LTVDREVQRVLTGGEGSARNLQLVIQFPQMEVIGGEPKSAPMSTSNERRFRRALTPVPVLRGRKEAGKGVWPSRDSRLRLTLPLAPNCGNWFERATLRLARASSTRTTASRRS
jgi:hypothetical protein